MNDLQALQMGGCAPSDPLFFDCKLPAPKGESHTKTFQGVKSEENKINHDWLESFANGGGLF